MACPYFDPVRPRGAWPEPRTAMLPLGDSWDGVCLADPGGPAAPGEEAVRSLCNLGYARRACPRFPAGDGADAARFAVSRDDGSVIRISWTLERDHLPFAHGSLAWSREGRSFAPDSPPPAPLRQAAAYVESYLRRLQAGREG